jgi:hypothetical protein
MAHVCTRTYINTAGDTIRVDTIYLEATRDVIMSGVGAKTYAQRVEKLAIYEAADRVVASIQLITDADVVTTGVVSGPLNYPTCSWTSTGAVCNMSGLPVIGDTV